MDEGFLYIDKEVGWSSRDICNKIQSIFHTKKVGHIGTLDPFATGLLIVSVNKATKAGQFLEALDKTYIATLVLGEKRDGGDITGDILESKEVKSFDIDYIKKILSSFIGEIDQIPPMKSAVHFNGRKLYQYDRDNIVVNPPSRKVKINSIELLSYKDNEISFITNVSKGTYIRVLGEDIANKLGTVGYLSSLRRTKVGELDVINAKKINEISSNDFISIPDALKNIKHIYIDEILEDKAKRGLRIFFKDIKSDNILLINKSGIAIAVYQRYQDDEYHSLRGLF